MRHLFLGLLLALAGVAPAAQEPSSEAAKPQPGMIQKVVEVQHQKVQEIANLLANSAVAVKPNEHFRAISLYGPKDLVEALEIEIRRLDKPIMVTSRNIELVGYLILAASKGTAGQAVPKDLEPVVKQLQNVFGFQDFRLFETAFMRNREGTQIEASGNARMLVVEQSPPASYSIRCLSTSISTTGDTRTIRLDGFRFGIRAPYSVGTSGQFQFAEIGFITNLDIREGQKVVVGQSRVGEGEWALVLVLTARVAE